MKNLELDRAIRGEYKSADLFLVPKAERYADLLETVFKAFDEETVALVIDEHSMPLTYYDAMEIPLDVFEEKYAIEDEEKIARDEAVSLARDLLELGLFDIGFRGKKVAVFISHDGYINVKPEGIERDEFADTIEEIDIND